MANADRPDELLYTYRLTGDMRPDSTDGYQEIQKALKSGYTVLDIVPAVEEGATTITVLLRHGDTNGRSRNYRNHG